MPDATPLPRPDPEPIVTFFAALGVTRLAELVEAGDLSSLSDYDLAQYCRLAASWLGPPLADAGEDLRSGAVQHFGYMLVQILAGEGPDYLEHDGEPFLRTETGERPVTPEMLRHLQWVRCLLSDEGTARAFLALAPEAAREDAEAHAGQIWEWEFDELARRLED